MSLGVTGILDAVVSHALATGLFDAVNAYEPKAAPGSGLTAAIWIQSLDPVRGSGLASTTVRIGLTVRLYTNMLSDPQDAIDPYVTGATDVLMAAYSNDFDLGGTVRNVDLLGQAGEPLHAQAGYLEQDRTMYRVMDITLPLIVNDVWGQAA